MGYVQLSNFNMYYKKEGSGEVIILLHGNGEDSRIFERTIKKLSKRYTVYALDTRGHGRSNGFPKEFHYKALANDVKDFMDAKKIKSAYVYGFSDGGIIAIYLTLLYPSYVKKLMFSGVNIFPKGLKLGSRIKMWFKAKFSKSKEIKILNSLMLKEPNLTFDDLKQIKVPTLMTVGKKDCVKFKHTLKIKEYIENSELLVVTNANHYNYICYSNSIGIFLLKYLTNQPQE